MNGEKSNNRLIVEKEVALRFWRVSQDKLIEAQIRNEELEKLCSDMYVVIECMDSVTGECFHERMKELGL